MKSTFWQTTVYRYIIFGCMLFVLMTVAAMFTYPGGNVKEEVTTGYDFFHNFFSDLGRIRVAGGNRTWSPPACSCADPGAGAGGFSLPSAHSSSPIRPGEAQHLRDGHRGDLRLCFVGIAWAPYDVLMPTTSWCSGIPHLSFWWRSTPWSSSASGHTRASMAGCSSFSPCFSQHTCPAHLRSGSPLICRVGHSSHGAESDRLCLDLERGGAIVAGASFPSTKDRVDFSIDCVSSIMTGGLCMQITF